MHPDHYANRFLRRASIALARLYRSGRRDLRFGVGSPVCLSLYAVLKPDSLYIGSLRMKTSPSRCLKQENIMHLLLRSIFQVRCKSPCSPVTVAHLIPGFRLYWSCIRQSQVRLVVRMRSPSQGKQQGCPSASGQRSWRDVAGRLDRLETFNNAGDLNRID